MENQKLTRPRTGRMLSGVCAAIANYFGLDATIVRIVYALLAVFTAFAGVIVYIILMIIIPEEPNNLTKYD